MESIKPVVLGRGGLRGELIEPPDARRANTRELVLQDGRRMNVPAELLQACGDGSFYLPLSLSDVERFAATTAAQAGTVIPLAREQLEVGKRKVQTGGVRVATHTREREEIVDIPLEREEVVVERVPVGKVVDVLPRMRQEGETLIVPLVEEVLVVEKRLVLREEVRLTTRRSQMHQPQRVMLRSEEAQIERIVPSSAPDQA